MASSNILTLDDFTTYLQTQKAVKRYDSATEPKPSHPWWNLDKVSIDNLLKEFALLVIDTLKVVPDADRELDYLVRTANDLTQVLRSRPIKVALIGAQGAGKSLMLNALFDRDGLSLTGADGTACTSAITRYAHYPSGNTDSGSKFGAEIKFLEPRKREIMLQDHARHYFDYFNDNDSDDEDNSHLRIHKQEEMDRRMKDTAEDIFTTLFGSREEFLDSWSPDAFRSGEFLQICQLKCEETISHYSVNNQHTAILMRDNQQELLQEIKPFLTKVKGIVCPWPLVDIITVRFDHELLHEGIELIDLPGWGDINLSRVRHAEEIKESVDVEIILADTIRIASDDLVINATRAALLHRGPSKVWLVATKTDVISPNQLAQCSGEHFEYLKQLMQKTEEELARVEEEEDDDIIKHDTLSKYKSYLERCRKQEKISERARDISQELTTKLKMRSTCAMPPQFHASASDYMDWIKKPKITFRDQPALFPDETSIPAIRKLLFGLPVQQNLNDYMHHLDFAIPNFIEKIKRTVMPSDRDQDFQTMADDFDRLHKSFMGELFADATQEFKKITKSSLSKMRSNADGFKRDIDSMLKKRWFSHRATSFYRIVRCKGTVPKGASKAKGLELGCNWNKDLSNIFASSFHTWDKTFASLMTPMRQALLQALCQIYKKTVKMMNDSTANLVVVEKSKRKWDPFKYKIHTKSKALLNQVELMQKRLRIRATAEDNAEITLVSSITDDIFDTVFASIPPTRTTASGKKCYVEPKYKYQTKVMEQLMLTSTSHFVGQIIAQFEKEVNSTMCDLLVKHFAEISKLFEEFDNALRLQAPIDYPITEVGQSIRADLQDIIPMLENKSTEMQSLLPVKIKAEDSEDLPGMGEPLDTKDGDMTLATLYENAKRKRPHDSNSSIMDNKLKQEWNLKSKKMKSEKYD